VIVPRQNEKDLTELAKRNGVQLRAERIADVLTAVVLQLRERFAGVGAAV
jgi:hypothetical protein